MPKLLPSVRLAPSLVAFLLGATGLTPAAAQFDQTPEAAIDQYYRAVDQGDCTLAIDLRPGYSLASCEAVQEVVSWRSQVLKQQGGKAAVFLQVELLRGGKTVSFNGVALLDNEGLGWRIRNGSFQSQKGDFKLSDYLASHFDPEPEEESVAAYGDPDPDPDVNNGAGSASLFAGGGGGADTSKPVQAPAPPISTSQVPIELAQKYEEAAVLAFMSYYDALDAEDCEFALDIRPGETLERCQAVKQVLQSEAEPVFVGDGQVVLRATIALRRAQDGDPGKLIDFRGFVTARQDDGVWKIVNDSYQNASETTGVEGYVRQFGLERRQGAADPLTEAVEAALRRDDSLRGAGLAPQSPSDHRLWSGIGPTTFGSRAVLESCWSRGQLAAIPGEERTTKTGPLAYMGDPDRLVPKRPLPRLPRSHLNSIRRVDTGGRKVVALTFDTGEQNNDFAGYDGEIYDYLRSQNVKATFYFGGKWMATHPDRTMQIIADPLFEPGNHAWTHGNMRVLSGQDALDQILFTQAQYELMLEELWAKPCAQAAGWEAFSKIPAAIPTFRYPYGTCSAETLDMVNINGMPAVQWDVVTADPVKKQSSQAIANIVTRRVKPGSIVIMHSNGRGWNTPGALPIFIPKLRDMGYEFVTVSELLAMGKPVATRECYEQRPGDNKHYDRIFGRGTGD